MELPSSQEVRRSLAGGIHLMRRDVSGMQFFNLTEEGFWRSFFAIILVLPLLFVAEAALGGGSAPLSARLARSSVNLLLHWMVFVALVLPICRAAGMGHLYMPFITVYNWCSVVGTSLLMVPALLTISGLFGFEAGQLLAFAVSVFIIFYLWFAAKTALDGNGWSAAGFVLMDFVLNIAVDGFFGLR
ncbi:MAG: hypothetical protein ACR2OR_00870 [Hyphomicrobiales bacterium]